MWKNTELTPSFGERIERLGARLVTCAFTVTACVMLESEPEIVGVTLISPGPRHLGRLWYDDVVPEVLGG